MRRKLAIQYVDVKDVGEARHMAERMAQRRERHRLGGNRFAEVRGARIYDVEEQGRLHEIEQQIPHLPQSERVLRAARPVVSRRASRARRSRRSAGRRLAARSSGSEGSDSPGASVGGGAS